MRFVEGEIATISRKTGLVKRTTEVIVLKVWNPSCVNSVVSVDIPYRGRGLVTLPELKKLSLV